jgi:hypothetical protein
MRKLIISAVSVAALAGAGVALAGQGATNPNGEFVDLSVHVTPPIAGTAKAPQGVGLSFDSFSGNRVNGAAPDNNTSITVRFNKGFKYNGLKFPACTMSTNPNLISSCSKASQIGAGTAEAQLAGATPVFVPANIIAYNGKPFGSNKAPTVIIISFLNGKPAAEIDLTAQQQPSGPYGLAFTQIILPGSSPAGFRITKFGLNLPDRTLTHRVHGKKVKLHLLEAPTTCHGSWQFAQTNFFSNAPALTATDSQPCVKR